MTPKMSFLVPTIMKAYEAATDPNNNPAYTTDPNTPNSKSLIFKSNFISLEAAGTMP